MPRFTTFALTGFVLACAVAMAALRYADDLWAGAMLLLALGLLGVALLGVIYQTGPGRSWWTGFAAFEGGYLLLAFGPWFATEVGPKLGTTQALAYVHERVVPSIPLEIRNLSVQQLQLEQDRLSSWLNSMQRVAKSPQGPTLIALRRRQNQVNRALAASGDTRMNVAGVVAAPDLASAPRSRWQTLLPGAAHREQFVTVGHCLFAMLAGLFGAWVASRFCVVRGVDGEDRPTGSSGVV